MATGQAGRSVGAMSKQIIVGYAGDRAGRDAAVLASELAPRLGADLMVAFPYHPLLATVSAAVAQERVSGELHALLGDEGPIATAEYRWSNASWPVRALHELAAFADAQMLVLGAAPERLERRGIGLMERVAHGSGCAIAVAPDGYAERPERALETIGVGFTDSQEARAAVALGEQLARGAGAELRVIAGSSLGSALASYAFSSPSLPLLEDELYTETKAGAEELLAELSPSEGVRLDVRRGDPCRVLVEASRGLDLLILGSRAYGPVRHVLLGGVSGPVMREAHCPVIVLPRDAIDSLAGAPIAPAGNVRDV